MTIQEHVNNILSSDTAEEWLAGVTSDAYSGGLCYSLYLDLDDDTLRIDCQADSNTWLQRSDHSLIRVLSHCDPEGGQDDMDGQAYFYAKDALEEALWEALTREDENS